MKTLQDYMEERQTALFEKTGSFFCFSKSQFDEKKKEGVNYVNMDAGLVCPKETAKELNDGLELIYRESIAQDIAENGMEAIITRELYNHEAFYTHNLESTFDALEDYGFDNEDIIGVFNLESLKQE